MPPPDVQELNSKAAQLRSLALHVESLPEKARLFVTQSMKDWQGPHADRIRSELNGWRTACKNAAEALRTEAGQCEQDAKDLQKK